MMKKVIAALLMLSALTLYAQEAEGGDESGGGLGGGFALGLGNEVIDGENYTVVALKPELGFGIFGIGLDINLRTTINFNDEGQPEFEIYKKDWVLEGDDATFTNYMTLYLSKINYLRVGAKDMDFYLKMGEINDGKLGNGFIMNNYSNAMRLPETKLFGLAFNLDGNLFSFPYVGIETFASNAGAFDLIGARLYVRPVKMLDIPLVSDTQIGFTYVTDRDPYFFQKDMEPASYNTTTVMGADIKIPVVELPIFNMDLYGDYVWQNDMKNTGAMFGFGGKIIRMISYDAQVRLMGEDFIPEYFNREYDLNRTGSRYHTMFGTPEKRLLRDADGNLVVDAEGNPTYEDVYYTLPATNGFMASLGANIQNIINIKATLTSPLEYFSENPTFEEGVSNPADFPSLRASAVLNEEFLKILSAEFHYNKEGIDSWNSLVDPTNAVIGGVMTYYAGSIAISYLMDIKYNSNPGYDPDTGMKEEKWDTTTKIFTTINF